MRSVECQSDTPRLVRRPDRVRLEANDCVLKAQQNHVQSPRCFVHNLHDVHIPPCLSR